MTETETEQVEQVRPEVVIDRQLADIYGRAQKVNAIRAGLHARFLHYAGAKKLGRYRWDMTGDEARIATGVKLAEGKFVSYEVRNVEDAVRQWNGSVVDLAKLLVEREPLELAYFANPWSRFFLVNGGHIHASQQCHTLRPTTQIGWLPELSGLTEGDAVQAHGTILCSHCFPTAPVEWCVGPVKTGQCPGVDQPAVDKTPVRGWPPKVYGVCAGCGQRFTVNGNGKPRSHKPKAG